MQRKSSSLKSLNPSDDCLPNDVSIPMDDVVVGGNNAEASSLSDDNNGKLMEYNDNDQTETEQDNSEKWQESMEALKANNIIRRLNTRLLDAIENKNTNEIVSSLQEGANPNATCFLLQISAVHAAAYANADALDILIKNGAETNRVDEYGHTPLQVAAWAGNDQAVKRLLDHQTAIPQHLSMPKSWIDSIDHKCENYMINIPKFPSDWTPLHVASYAANHSTTQLLLANGFDPNNQDANRQTPLDITGAACFLEEHEVNVENYVNTIKILIEFGAKFDSQEFPLHTFQCIDRICDCINAVHTAVELCSVDAIKMLLAVEAHVTYHNGRGNTPLHECVIKHYEEPLELLLNHRSPTLSKSPADLTDLSKDKRTVLHLAITNCWAPGVRLALEAGADVAYKVKSIELSAIHVAASCGNVVILREVLKYVHDKNAVSYESEIVDAPIVFAMRSGNMNCVDILIKAGASLYVKHYTNAVQFRYHEIFNFILGYSDNSGEKSEEANPNLLIHAAIDIGDIHVLKNILKYDSRLFLLLEYKNKVFMNKTPVEYSIWCIKNRNKKEADMEILTFLLEKTSGIEQFDPPIYCSILENPVTSDDDRLFSKISSIFPEVLQTHRSQLLHYAIKNINEKMILKLITCGADLSATCNGVTAISSLMSVHPNATEFMESILDFYVDTNEFPINHKNNQINIKYNVLVPPQKGPLERMKVISALVNTGNRKGQTKLLKHLLVESFIYWNWKAFLRFFYTLIFMYSLFTTSLTIYIVSFFYFKDVEEPVPVFFSYLFSPWFWQGPVYVTLIILLILEGSFALIPTNSWKDYFKTNESKMKLATYSFSFATVVAMFYLDSADREWMRHLASLTLGLAWVNLMVFFSSTPSPGLYIQIFWKVTKEIGKILLFFSLLIIMFCSIFMIQFRSKKPFDDPITALVQTLVMMTSEFDYGDNFGNSGFIVRLIFVLFLVLIAIVIMNLMIGIAVNDVQDLVENGTIRRLEMQVYLINKLEVSMRHQNLIFYFRCVRRLFQSDKVPIRIHINPFLDSVTMNPLVGSPGFTPVPVPLRKHEINLYMEAIIEKVRDLFPKRHKKERV